MRVGYLEADTVAHCGNSLSGDFAWTLTFVDILSGWTQCRAIWNKGHQAIHQHLKAAEEKSPFRWLAFDCDNGSEFLNHALWDHYAKRKHPVQFTRSRPYHKNDNAHVEQKNWSAVRQLLGYERLDNPQVVAPLDDLYQNEWHWLVNFFCPTFKLIDKKKVGSKYVKRYEKPRTPYARLLESAEVPRKEKQKLRAIREVWIQSNCAGESNRNCGASSRSIALCPSPPRKKKRRASRKRNAETAVNMTTKRISQRSQCHRKRRSLSVTINVSQRSLNPRLAPVTFSGESTRATIPLCGTVLKRRRVDVSAHSQM